MPRAFREGGFAG